MKHFTTLEGVAAALLQDNIDTDVIVRIAPVSRLVRGQFAPWAFEDTAITVAGRAMYVFWSDELEDPYSIKLQFPYWLYARTEKSAGIRFFAIIVLKILFMKVM